ncbi:hypothetical protein DFH06DRAFT_1135988 [Mycena polygramma]|nr:hypothetical protein DFH06DRAFT_1135988 [Mycena polygramma]
MRRRESAYLAGLTSAQVVVVNEEWRGKLLPIRLDTLGECRSHPRTRTEGRHGEGELRDMSESARDLPRLRDRPASFSTHGGQCQRIREFETLVHRRLCTPAAGSAREFGLIRVMPNKTGASRLGLPPVLMMGTAVLSTG